MFKHLRHHHAIEEGICKRYLLTVPYLRVFRHTESLLKRLNRRPTRIETENIDFPRQRQPFEGARANADVQHPEPRIDCFRQEPKASHAAVEPISRMILKIVPDSFLFQTTASPLHQTVNLKARPKRSRAVLPSVPRDLRVRYLDGILRYTIVIK